MQLFEKTGRLVEPAAAVFTTFALVVERLSGIPRCKIHVLREIDLRSLIAPTRTRALRIIPYSSPST